MGSAVLAPRPLEPSNATLRVYGAFATKEDARDHADVVRSVDATCSLALVRRGEWVLLPQTIETRDDPEANARGVRQRLEAHAARRERDDRKFETTIVKQVIINIINGYVRYI